MKQVFILDNNFINNLFGRGSGYSEERGLERLSHLNEKYKLVITDGVFEEATRDVDDPRFKDGAFRIFLEKNDIIPVQTNTPQYSRDRGEISIVKALDEGLIDVSKGFVIGSEDRFFQADSRAAAYADKTVSAKEVKGQIKAEQKAALRQQRALEAREARRQEIEAKTMADKITDNKKGFVSAAWRAIGQLLGYSDDELVEEFKKAGIDIEIAPILEYSRDDYMEDALKEVEQMTGDLDKVVLTMFEKAGITIDEQTAQIVQEQLAAADEDKDSGEKDNKDQSGLKSLFSDLKSETQASPWDLEGEGLTEQFNVHSKFLKSPVHKQHATFKY